MALTNIHESPQQSLQKADFDRIINEIKLSGNLNRIFQDVKNSNIWYQEITASAQDLTKFMTSVFFNFLNLKHFNLPGNPEFFVGRKQVLQQIHQNLTQSPYNVWLLSGIGGIGKTTIAHKYIYTVEAQAKFNKIIYLTVEQSTYLDEILNTVAKALQIDLSGYISVEEKKQVIATVMQNTGGYNLLLIDDNLNDAKQLTEIKSFLESTNWKVLITTRTQPDAYAKSTITVKELDLDSAIELFEYHYNDKAADTLLLEKLLNHIDRHTLLIELLGKIGYTRALTIKELYDIIKAQDRLMQSLSDKRMQRKIHIGRHAEILPGAQKEDTIYRYILGLIQPEKVPPQYHRDLKFFSILPAEDIPLEHLKILWNISEKEEIAFEDRLDFLKQYGWLSKTFKQLSQDKRTIFYRMHHLIQEVVYEKLTPTIDQVMPLIERANSLIEQATTEAYDFLPYAEAIIQKLEKVMQWIAQNDE